MMLAATDVTIVAFKHKIHFRKSFRLILHLYFDNSYSCMLTRFTYFKLVIADDVREQGEIKRAATDVVSVAIKHKNTF
jgi:hypothetical protein